MYDGVWDRQELLFKIKLLKDRSEAVRKSIMPKELADNMISAGESPAERL